MSSLTIGESYAWCHQRMRSAAANFYYGMRLLPEAKRRAMYALYGYMRLIDDIADDNEPPGCPAAILDVRRARLEAWRTATRRAVAGESDAHPLWPAFTDTVRRFQIPVQLFEDAIDGQLQDLAQPCYDTFQELYRYCYRVASTVGIAAVHIWGFRDPVAIKLAEERGIALQLTNILRDIREDATRGRRYIPEEDCRQFACDWDISSATPPPGFEDLLRFEAGRARDYYERSALLESLVDADARPTLRIMTAIYRRILERIAAVPRSVLVRRVGLSSFEKLALVLRHAWQSQMAALEGNG